MRAVLGIDGNCGFALLGENLQEGEAEFEPVVPIGDELNSSAELRACRIALTRLKKRLGLSDLPFAFGPSHPYGS